ncbi:MAG: spore cortex biosynthesis protein YabQ [Clostridium sp.]
MIEISPEISGEALRFLLFMLAGILLILAFDLFRILRRLIPQNRSGCSGGYAVRIGSAIFIFIMLCRENDGAIRGFACWA